MNNLRALNPEQVAGLFRTALLIIGTILATAGWMNDTDWAVISGPILTFATTIWGFVVRKDTNLIRSASEVPAVSKIVAPGTEVARDDSYPKVTSN